MKYEKKNGKYIFNKDGVHFSLTLDQVEDMFLDLLEIQHKDGPASRAQPAKSVRVVPLETLLWSKSVVKRLNVQQGRSMMESVDEVREAFETIKQAMVDGCPSEPGSYAHSWHCCIAMMCHDAIVDADLEIDKEGQKINPHRVGNDAATRFMKMCFGVDTSA